jgi:hypothetical protein
MLKWLNIILIKNYSKFLIIPEFNNLSKMKRQVESNLEIKSLAY